MDFFRRVTGRLQVRLGVGNKQAHAQWIGIPQPRHRQHDSVEGLPLAVIAAVEHRQDLLAGQIAFRAAPVFRYRHRQHMARAQRRVPFG